MPGAATEEISMSDGAGLCLGSAVPGLDGLAGAMPGRHANLCLW